MEKTITLQIFGRNFTFQTDSGVSDAEKVAAHFEKALKRVQTQVEGKPVSVDKETILILTALNIASENYQIEERYNQLIHRMTERSAVVLDELEKAIV